MTCTTLSNAEQSGEWRGIADVTCRAEDIVEFGVGQRPSYGRVGWSRFNGNPNWVCLRASLPYMYSYRKDGRTEDNGVLIDRDHIVLLPQVMDAVAPASWFAAVQPFLNVFRSNITYYPDACLMYKRVTIVGSPELSIHVSEEFREFLASTSYTDVERVICTNAEELSAILAERIASGNQFVGGNENITPSSSGWQCGFADLNETIIHSRPDGEEVGDLSDGLRVNLVAKSGDSEWVRVERVISGWVRREQIDCPDVVDELPTWTEDVPLPDWPLHGVVKTYSDLEIGSNFGYAPIGHKIPDGMPVELYSQDRFWVRVASEDGKYEGWLPKDNIETDDDMSVLPIEKRQVACNGFLTKDELRLCSEPDGTLKDIDPPKIFGSDQRARFVGRTEASDWLFAQAVKENDRDQWWVDDDGWVRTVDVRINDGEDVNDLPVWT